MNLTRFLVTAIISAVAVTMSAQSADTVKKGRIIDSATGKATEVALPYNPGDGTTGPIYVEREKAIEIAMSQFGNSAGCDYYASWSGSKLITDPKVCYADDIPDGGGWVRSGYHWLIFVDEAPTKSWEHECSYVYVECEVPSIRDTPKCCVVRGKKPSYDIRSFEARSAVNRYGAKANQKPSVAASESTYNSAVGGRTYALIMDCASDVLDNFERCWNDCSFIYQTLHKRYNVPKDNISVVIGIDEYDTNMRKADGSGYTYNSHDFDFDGVAEVTSPIASEDLDYELLYRIKKNITKQDQLFIFFTGNGGYDAESGRYYAQMHDRERLYADELALKLDEIEARSVCIVLGQSYAGGFAKELEGKGRVICAGCGTDEAAVSCRDLPYTEFLYRWTSAMNMADAEGNHVAADTDNNGRVTVEEAFSYAQKQMSSTTPAMTSTPLYIQEDMAFNNIPEAVDLYIRDYVGDKGKEPSKERKLWNSPDIWVRNQNDGAVHTKSEPIILDKNSIHKTVYVYVRVINRGQDEYDGIGQNLHLYWCNSMLNEDFEAWLAKHNDYNKEQSGGKAEIQQLDSVIHPLGYEIRECQFSVPTDIVKWAKKHGEEKLNLNFLARVSEEDNSLIDEDNPNDSLRSNYRRIRYSNNIAQKSLVYVGPKDRLTIGGGCTVGDSTIMRKLVIENIECDTLPDDRLFDNVDMAFELSPKMYDTWTERGGKDANDVVSFDTNPRKLYFTSKDSYIGGICLANVSDSLTITFDRIANVGSLQPMKYNFDIVQKIASSDEVTAGVSVNYYAEARSQTMEPAVDIEETGGEYVLKENNINEDATYQWYDANGTSVASGKVATIDASKASGTYRLKVRAASDGAVNYAMVSLDKIPVMESVSPSPFDNELTISLRRAAKSSTHVLITGVTNPSVQKDFLMRSGESRMTIYTSDYPKGTYLVTIMENGEILDTKTVVK